MSVYSTVIPKRIVEESNHILHLQQSRNYPFMVLLIRAFGTVYVLASLVCAGAWLSLTRAIWLDGMSDIDWKLKAAVLCIGLPTFWFCIVAGGSGIVYSVRFEDIKFDARSRTMTLRLARFPLFLGTGLWTKYLHFSSLAEVQVIPRASGKWRIDMVPKEGEPLAVDILSNRDDAVTLSQKIASFCDIPWRVVE